MLRQEGDSELPAPAQIIAQVAPPQPLSSAPLAGPHTKPQSGINIAPDPADTALFSSQDPTAASKSDSSLCPVSSTVGVDPCEGAQSSIDTEVLSASPHDDNNSSPEVQGDKHLELRPQDRICFDSLRPMTPTSTQNWNNMSPGHVRPSAPLVSQDSDASIPVTSLSLEFSQEIIDAHYKQAKGIYGKTRSLMRTCTKRMSLVASRGFQRGYLPTRRTRPPLRKRRYSVDVNTAPNWAQFNCLQETPLPVVQRQSHETDPVPLSTTVTGPVPDTFRHPALGSIHHYRSPQFNEDVYLRLGDAVLKADSYVYIGVTDISRYSYNVWMSGDGLDMAMEVLRRDEKCNSHSIAIANSAVAQICYFASMSEDSSPQEYNDYKIKYEDKRWVFIIINDAIGGVENDSDQGTHWSFVALDRGNKGLYYYDSLWAQSETDTYYRDMGKQVGGGMLKILGEDVQSWYWSPERYTPHQNQDNRFPFDGGACGPFVFKLMQHFIRQIKYCHSIDQEHRFRFELGWDFPTWFRNNCFDSLETRIEIQIRIARWKAIVEGAELANSHDQAVLLDENVVIDDTPMDAVHDPPRIPFFDSGADRGNRISSEASSPSTTGSTIVASSDPMDVKFMFGDTEDEESNDDDYCPA